MSSSKELRAKAKATLGGKRLKGGWMWPVLLGFITTAITSALSLVSPFVVAILGVAGAAYYVALVRRTAEAKEIGIYFKTMGSGIGKNIKLSLVITIYQLLWMFVPIAGLIKPYSYAMTYYIKADNPELTANEAITKSRQMMNGYKWKLFCLEFSFIGWHILTACTFGILGIWVTPHIAAAKAEFYEELKAANAGEIVE